jgi:hypothetical protein
MDLPPREETEESLASPAPRATSTESVSHEGRSLATLGMTSKVEGLGMTWKWRGSG